MVGVVDESVESGEPRRAVSTGDIVGEILGEILGEVLGEIGKKGRANDGDGARWQRESSVEARLMASSMEPPLLLLLERLFLSTGHRRPRQRFPEW